jgi:macrolide-specific efflux system membrane fusion protein
MSRMLSYLFSHAGVAVLVLGAATAAQGALQQDGATRPADRYSTSTPSKTGTEKAFTKPSEERDLDFGMPGLVIKVNVVDGQPVKKNDILAQQDTSVEEANKKTFEIEATSKVEEEYAKKDVEVKKIKVQRMEWLRQRNNATELEVKEAKLEVERAIASVELAKQKSAIAAAQAATEQAKINLKQIKSPIDGVVAALDTHVGEVATSNPQKPAIKVVKNDPLWIDVHFPVGQVAKLKPGQKLQVRYLDEDKWMPAEVLFLQPLVRAGSQTRTVRVVMPNPDEKPAGLEVFVKLPDAAVAAGNGSDAGVQR